MRQIRAGADAHGTIDKRFVRKNGSELWVRRSATVVRDASGQVRFVVGAFIDLTVQRSADIALEQQMHFTRALLDAIPNPVYFKDREGPLRRLQPRLRRPVRRRARLDRQDGPRHVRPRRRARAPRARPPAARAAGLDHLRDAGADRRGRDPPDALQQGELRRPARRGGGADRDHHRRHALQGDRARARGERGALPRAHRELPRPHLGDGRRRAHPLPEPGAAPPAGLRARRHRRRATSPSWCTATTSTTCARPSGA